MNVPRLAVGTRVEVRDRFRGLWNRGFEVVGKTRLGYCVIRRSDGYALPVEFAASAVRREA